MAGLRCGSAQTVLHHQKSRRRASWHGVRYLRQPIHDVMAERGEMRFQVITHEATGRYVALFSLQAPLVQYPKPDETMPMFTGLQFRLFLDMTYQRDTLWLTYANQAD